MLTPKVLGEGSKASKCIVSPPSSKVVKGEEVGGRETRLDKSNKVKPIQYLELV